MLVQVYGMVVSGRRRAMTMTVRAVHVGAEHRRAVAWYPVGVAESLVIDVAALFRDCPD
jgi:hypothetical protein